MGKTERAFEIVKLLKEKPRTIKELSHCLSVSYDSTRRSLKELETLKKVKKHGFFLYKLVEKV